MQERKEVLKSGKMINKNTSFVDDIYEFKFSTEYWFLKNKEFYKPFLRRRSKLVKKWQNMELSQVFSIYALLRLSEKFEATTVC